MQKSAGRFLTTHTGSLPRPDDLIRAMYAKEEGVPVEPVALAAQIRAVVARQAAAGVNLVNDGEMSKPSYATYIKDRLDGFGGTGNTIVYQDVHEFPRLEKKVFGDPGRSRRKTPATCARLPSSISSGEPHEPAHRRRTAARPRHSWPTRRASASHSPPGGSAIISIRLPSRT